MKDAVARTLAGGLLTAAVVWGLALFGATQHRVLYQAFVLLLLALGVAAAAVPMPDGCSLRVRAALGVVGVALLANVVLQSTAEARGYVVAAVGWLCLVNRRFCLVDQQFGLRRLKARGPLTEA